MSSVSLAGGLFNYSSVLNGKDKSQLISGGAAGMLWDRALDAAALVVGAEGQFCAAGSISPSQNLEC